MKLAQGDVVHLVRHHWQHAGKRADGSEPAGIQWSRSRSAPHACIIPLRSPFLASRRFARSIYCRPSNRRNDCSICSRSQRGPTPLRVADGYSTKLPLFWYFPSRCCACSALFLSELDVEASMLLLLAAALLGGLITFAVLWPYGALIAIVGAPFGGSALALLAGLLLAFLRTRVERQAKRRVLPSTTKTTT
jgi:hypothetical protein